MLNNCISISICLCTFNGEYYIFDQIASIINACIVVPGLAWEIVISDDGSSDQTISTCHLFNYDNIRVVAGPQKGVSKNFENAIIHAQYDYIILSDQDDLWLPHRIICIIGYIGSYDVILSNCYIVNSSLAGNGESYFDITSFHRFWPKLLYSNFFVGALMCCKSSFLKSIMPFPPAPLLHDIWIGMNCLISGSLKFDNTPIMLYRRHEKSYITIGLAKKSLNDKLLFKIKYNFLLAYFFLKSNLVK